MPVKAHFVDPVLTFHLAVVPGRCRTDQMMDDSHVCQRLLKQGFIVWIVGNQPFRELRSVICLHLPDHEGRVGNQAEKKLLRTVSAVLVVHLPVCPAAAFILGGVLVVLSSIRYAVAGDELYVDLHLLARVFRPLIRFVLTLWRLLFEWDLPVRRPLEAAIAPRIAILAGFLIGKEQVFAVFLAHPQHQLDFPRLLCSRTSFGPSALLVQTGCRPVPPLSPFPDRLSRDPVVIGCLLYTVMLQIQHHPLTKVRVLCYPFHCRESFL